MNCPACLSPSITACHKWDEARSQLVVGAFWCQQCGHITPPIGRERTLPVSGNVKDESCTKE